MPPSRTLKRTVAKLKTPALSNPNFENKQDIIFNDEILDHDGESCLLFDSGRDDQNRFLVFSNSQLMRFASQCRKFQMDGTFSLAPKCYNNGRANLSGQVYSIHARKGSMLIPCFYILMAKKTKQEYTRVFTAIQSLVTLNVENVMLDLEMGAIGSVAETFNATISLCYYHFQESIYSWVNEHGMKMKYLEDDSFRKLVHMHGALAFVPVNDVIQAWNDLCSYLSEHFEDDSQADDFNAYIEQSFIGRIQPDGSRRSPKYRIEYWNQYSNVLAENSRTNNGIEGWHNGLNHLGDCSHPNVYKFVSILQKDMLRSKLKIEEDAAGHVRAPRRITYVDFDARVKNIVAEYGASIKIEYLQRIAVMFHFM